MDQASVCGGEVNESKPVAMTKQRGLEGDGRFWPFTAKEKDAFGVYDLDAGEFVATVQPIGPWPLSKSKTLRERGSGHRCVYVGWPKGSRS